MSLPNAYYLLAEKEFDRALCQLKDTVGSVVQAGSCIEIGNVRNADGVTLWIEAKHDGKVYIGVLLSFPTKDLECVFAQVCRVLEERGGVRIGANEFSQAQKMM